MQLIRLAMLFEFCDQYSMNYVEKQTSIFIKEDGST